MTLSLVNKPHRSEALKLIRRNDLSWSLFLACGHPGFAVAYALGS